MEEILKRLALVCASVAISLAGAEIALRYLRLQNPFIWLNFAYSPVNQQVETNRSFMAHPLLGHIGAPGFRDQLATHGAHGERLNLSLSGDEPLPKLRKGGVLAVGDSFTFGSEVSDSESWPAQLEKLLNGIPVTNAGAGGYGLDQAILRAELLLDVFEPQVIIVSFIPQGISRNTYAVNAGLPKPYFDVVEGALVLRNVPVTAEFAIPVRGLDWFRSVFGYTYSIYVMADALGMRTRWVRYEPQSITVHNQPREVSCLLWRRLATKVLSRGIKLMALAQYAGIQVTGHDNSRDFHGVVPVLECAAAAGFVTVDSYGALRRRFETDESKFWPLWTKLTTDKKWHTGHMSAEGNRLTAELVADAFRNRIVSK